MLPDTTGIEAKKSGFAPLPDGQYFGKIFKIDEGISQNGNPFVGFEINIIESEYAGRKVWKRCYFKGENEEKTQKALGMWAGVLEDLGMNQEQRHATKTIEQLREFALSLKVELYLTIKEYNGKISNEVSGMEAIEEKPF